MNDNFQIIDYFKNKKSVILLILSILTIFSISLFFMLQPARSVENFCRIAKEQKSVLTSNVGYDKRLIAYKKLEQVAPNEIHSDITAIRKGYEKITEDSSNSFSVGITVSSAEDNTSEYIKTNCIDN